MQYNYYFQINNYLCNHQIIATVKVLKILFPIVTTQNSDIISD